MDFWVRKLYLTKLILELYVSGFTFAQIVSWQKFQDFWAKRDYINYFYYIYSLENVSSEF